MQETLFPFAQPEIAVEINAIKKSFGERQVLNGITLSIPKGSLTALIGPSGCGKTTLLRCLNGLEVFDAGQMRIKEVTIERPRHQGEELRRLIVGLRRHVGMIFQSYNLFPHMTVLDNITLAPRQVKGESKKVAEDKAMDLLRVVGLADRAKVYPSFLSGGQQQRVAIARGLAMEPDVMLYDEPTSALDSETVDEVLDVMKALDARDMTQVVVTHEIAFAHDVAEQVIFLDHGAVVEQGPPSQVLKDPQNGRTRTFLKRFLAAS